MTLAAYEKKRKEFWKSKGAYLGDPVGGGNVSCPKCKKLELVYKGMEILNHGIPPKRPAECPNCGYKVTVTA